MSEKTTFADALVSGRWVRVYQKPLTDEDFEGIAQLVKCSGEQDGGERWLVRFPGDEEHMVVRFVRLSHLVKAALTAEDLPHRNPVCERCGKHGCVVGLHKLYATDRHGVTTGNPFAIHGFVCEPCFALKRA